MCPVLSWLGWTAEPRASGGLGHQPSLSLVFLYPTALLFFPEHLATSHLFFIRPQTGIWRTEALPAALVCKLPWHRVGTVIDGWMDMWVGGWMEGKKDGWMDG